MQIRIFQIDSDYDEDSLKFRGLEQTMELRGGAGIDPGIYEEVFRGDVNCKDLEEVYSLFNMGGHPLHRGHSLSISDVVLTENGTFFCDHLGFKQVDFDPAKAHKPDALLRIVYVEPGRPPFVSEVGRDLLWLHRQKRNHRYGRHRRCPHHDDRCGWCWENRLLAVSLH